MYNCLWPPWTVAHQAPLSSTMSQSFLKLMSIVLVMLSNHLILCLPLSFCLQSFPASGSFPMNWLFMSGGQSRIPDPKDILDFWSPSHPTSKMKFVGRPSWPRSYESFFFFFLLTHASTHQSLKAPPSSRSFQSTGILRPWLCPLCFMRSLCPDC